MEHSGSVPEAGNSGGEAPKRKGFRGGRGRGSHQRHQDAFRRRVGDKVQQEYKRQIEQRHPTLEDLHGQLTRMMVSGDPVTIELPCTLRGVALLTVNAYERAKMELKRDPPLSINAFYRLTLAQVQLQMIRAQMQMKGVATFPRMRQQRLVQPWLNFDEAVASHPATLRALASVINVMGAFSDNGVNYIPVVPASGFDTLTLTMSPAASAPGKRPRCGGIEAPDPYAVTFTNLRDTVVALSNPETPIDVRRYFFERNVLPNAQWTEDFVLMNPDDIMPPGYAHLDMEREFGLLDNMTSMLSGSRTNYLVGSLGFHGTGTKSLLTFHVDELLRIESDGSGNWITSAGGSGRLMTPQPSTDIEMLIGGLGMFERPDIIRLSRGDVSENFSIRSHRVACKRLDVPWTTLWDRFSVRPGV